MPKTTSAPAGLAAAGLSEGVLRGIMLVALGYLVNTMADAAVKWALPETGIAGAMIWRGAAGATTVALLARGRGLIPHRYGLMTLRCVCHALGTAVFYLCWIRSVPLGSTYAITSAVPLIATILAIPLLGEQVGWRRWASIGVGFCGVLLMLRPGGDLWRWETALLIIATISMGFLRIWTRILVRTETASGIAFWILIWQIPIGLLLLPVAPAPHAVPAAFTIVLLLALGLFNAAAQMLFARAFSLASVSTLAPYEYLPLPFGMLIGLMLWGEIPAWTTLAGAGIVVLAGGYNLHRERLLRRRALQGAAATTAPSPKPQLSEAKA